MTKSAGKITITFEATKEERRQIKRNAAWFGLSQAEFLRQSGTGRILDMQHYVQRGRFLADRERRREAAA